MSTKYIIPLMVTEDEANAIMNERKAQVYYRDKMERHRTCPHTNKIDKGRWGHNGDQYWYCNDCQTEWTDD